MLETTSFEPQLDSKSELFFFFFLWRKTEKLVSECLAWNKCSSVRLPPSKSTVVLQLQLSQLWFFPLHDTDLVASNECKKKKEKLHGVVFYFPRSCSTPTDMEWEREKIKRKIPRPLTYMQVVFKYWPEVIGITMAMGRQYCASFTWDGCHIFTACSSLALFPEPGFCTQRRN